MQSGAATLEDGLAFLTKLSVVSLYNSAAMLLGVYSDDLKMYLHTTLRANTYNTFIHIC